MNKEELSKRIEKVSKASVQTEQQVAGQAAI